MSDETIQIKNEEVDVLPDESDAETEDVSDTDPETSEETAHPYIKYTGGPRRTGSIWNSPLGLVAIVYIASKVIDLTYRVVIENQKAKRAED